MSADRLHAVEIGTDGPVVAFLHGFGDTHGVWAGVQSALAGDARTIAFDLPGHGASLDYPDAGRTKVAVAALLTEIGALQAGPVNLVGHSMGGAVAALATLENPDAVASLTLLAPGGFGSEINHRLLNRYAAAEDAEALRMALENMYGWNKPVGDGTVERLVTMRRRPGQRDMLMHMAAGLHRDGKQGIIPRENLDELRMPVKVLWGTQDRVLPTRQAHRLPAMFAAHIFEDTGHMLPEEIPDAAAKLIRQNLR